MTPPTTYGEWVPIIKLFTDNKQDDEELLAVMELGTIVWSSGVAEKFYGRLHACFENRLAIINKKFNSELSFSSLNGFSIAIVQFRQRFRPLRRLANIEGFTDELKERLNEHLELFAQASHDTLLKELEKRAKHENHFGEFLVELKKTPIFVPEHSVEVKSQRDVNNSVIIPNRKRNILL